MPLDGPLHKAANDGDVKALERLVAEKHEIDAPGANDRTPLHRAVGAGSVAAVKFLLSKGAKVDAKDRQGRTPFHWAALEGNDAILDILLKNGTLDVNAKGGESGKTALHFAVMNKKMDAIRFLCGLKEVDRGIKDSDGLTPWELFLSSNPNADPPASLNPSFTVDKSGAFTPEANAKDTLYKLLGHPKGKALFYDHLRKNFAEENYLLYEELLKLSELKSLEEKLERGQEIYLTFISQTGTRATFLPEEVVAQFNRSRNADEVEAFDNAIRVVKEACFGQLLDIFISAFSISSEYRSFLENPNSVEVSSIPTTTVRSSSSSSSNEKGTVGLLFGGGDPTKFANVLGIGQQTNKGLKDVNVDSILAETQATLAAIEKQNEGKAPAPLPEDYESSDSDAYLLSDSDEEDEEEDD